MWLDGGVYVLPQSASKGELVKIGYKGLLVNSGADGVYLHYGYDGWNNPRTVPMTREPNGAFAAPIELEGAKEINFCFKDSAANWDNNSGWDWSFEIKSKF